MNSTLNQMKFYRLALMIAQNSGELEKNQQKISSEIVKTYGLLTGVSKGTGTILNITKIACGLGKYVEMELETRYKIEYLLECFDKAEKIAIEMQVKKYAKRRFEAKFPEYYGKKFSYFQHVWNLWISKDPKRKEIYDGGVFEDSDMKLQVDVQVDESERIPDLPLEA